MKIGQIKLVAETLLRNLKFWHNVVAVHATKQRAEWFAQLKIQQLITDLDAGIVVEVPVEQLEFVVRLHDATLRFQ